MKFAILLLTAFAMVLLTVAVLSRAGRFAAARASSPRPPRQVVTAASASVVSWQHRQNQPHHWRDIMLNR
jgi:hypothetical protein